MTYLSSYTTKIYHNSVTNKQEVTVIPQTKAKPEDLRKSFRLVYGGKHKTD